MSSIRRGILNGVEIPETEYPVVGVVSDANASFTCTGTLIAPQWVLTVAHCVQGQSNLVFITGGLADTPERQNYNILKVEIYPYYRGEDNLGSDDSHDIGLIQLDRDCPITPMIVNTNRPQIGDILTIVGYGYGGTGDTGGDGITGIKRKGTTTLEAVSSTLLAWIFNTGESNTAPGDSGGPAFLPNETIAGITSAGQIPEVYGSVAYDTRVDAYLTWITAIITPTQSNSDSTQAPPDHTDVQNSDGTEVRVNYHATVQNAITIISG